MGSLLEVDWDCEGGLMGDMAGLGLCVGAIIIVVVVVLISSLKVSGECSDRERESGQD